MTTGRLPRRDLLLVPLIAIATLIALAVGSELTARALFHESASSTMACLVVDDPATGVRGVPNSRCRQQSFESPPVDYRFNGCGFRTPQACAPAAPGVTRVVLVGSSMAFGMHVDQPHSLAGQLGPALGRRLGRPVDLFNEGLQWGTPAGLARRTDAMLAVRPDLILWVLTPFDIENARLVLPYVPGRQMGLQSPPPPPAIDAPLPATGVASLPTRAWARLIATLSASRGVFMLQHALFRSESQYLGHTLAQGGSIDYLRTPVPAPLADEMAVFSDDLDRIAAAARAAHVPLAITLMPSRAQVIMLANGRWDAGYDPGQLGRLLGQAAARAGVRYVDMTRGIAAVPHAGARFFAVDEHMPPDGHRMMTDLLADALVRDHAVPATAEGAR